MDWLFRAVDGEARVVEPAPKLPDPPLRRWVWLSVPEDEAPCDCEAEEACGRLFTDLRGGRLDTEFEDMTVIAEA